MTLPILIYDKFIFKSEVHVCILRSPKCSCNCFNYLQNFVKFQRFCKFWGKISQIFNIMITGSSLEIGGMASPNWRRGLRLQPISAAYWVSQMGGRDYTDNNNSIHPRCLSSLRLWVREIPSVESLVTSRNMTRAAQLPEQNSPLQWLVFIGNWGALTGYVVCNALAWNLLV
jgi:hypothetical protein